MQSIRKTLLGVSLAATLVISSSAVAADREAGPRDRADRPTIVKIIKRLIVRVLGDISIPPGH